MEYSFKIKRFNPETDKKPHWEAYKIEAEPNDRLLDGLQNIKWYVDGTLTLRRSCAHGICGSDAMMINGRNRLACKVIMRDVARESSPIVVEPLRGFPIIKDLVVDMEGFFAKYRAIKPFLINDEPPPERERLQSIKDRARFDDTTKCILCASCTTACPTYWADREYIGPAAIVQAHRFIFDSRDEGADERLNILGERGGVFSCRSIFNCSQSCPREIDIVKAINEVRQALLFQNAPAQRKKTAQG
ncbi:MAG: succinate dehydrogenase iron-sulfur subunit [Rudaea sp.]